eukprot:jgi/Mesvir1/23438/Mv22294-RA.2
MWEKEGDEKDSELGSDESGDEEEGEEEEDEEMDEADDDRTSKMLIKGRWFYQKHDLEEFRLSCRKKEVLLECGMAPAVSDANPVTVFIRKARVVCLANHPGIRKPTQQQIDEADFFLSQGIDTTRRSKVPFQRLLQDLARFNKYKAFDPRLVIKCEDLNNPKPPRLTNATATAEPTRQQPGVLVESGLPAGLTRAAVEGARGGPSGTPGPSTPSQPPAVNERQPASETGRQPPAEKERPLAVEMGPSQSRGKEATVGIQHAKESTAAGSSQPQKGGTALPKSSQLPLAATGGGKGKEIAGTSAAAPHEPSGTQESNKSVQKRNGKEPAEDGAGASSDRKSAGQQAAGVMAVVKATAKEPSDASLRANDGKGKEKEGERKEKEGKRKAVGDVAEAQEGASKKARVLVPASATTSPSPSAIPGSRPSATTPVAAGSKLPRPMTTTSGVARPLQAAKAMPVVTIPGSTSADARASMAVGAGTKSPAAQTPPATSSLSARPPSSLKQVANDESPRGPGEPPRKPSTAGASGSVSVPRTSTSVPGSSGGGGGSGARPVPGRPELAGPSASKPYKHGKHVGMLMGSGKRPGSSKLTFVKARVPVPVPATTTPSHHFQAKAGTVAPSPRSAPMLPPGPDESLRARSQWRKDYSREQMVLQAVKSGRVLYLDNIPLLFDDLGLWDVLVDRLPGLEDVRLLPCWDLEGHVLREEDIQFATQQGYAVFQSQRLAVEAEQIVDKDLLLLEAGEDCLPCPLLATPAAESRWIFGLRLRSEEWAGCFHGHMLAEMDRCEREEKGQRAAELSWNQRNAYTSMHFAQPTNIEYTFAVQWALLMRRQEEERKLLMEVRARRRWR